MTKKQLPSTFYPPEIRPTWMAYGLFALKFILLVALIVLQTQYQGDLEAIGVPEHYIKALLFFLTGQLVISFARISISAIYRRRTKVSKHRKDNFILGINQIAGIGSFIIFVLATLIIFNIDIKEALTAVSIVAAAIAILSKDYVSNMINGMILMFSDQIRLGDKVKIGDHEGKIIDLTLMHVHLVNADNHVIFIPNSLILTAGVTNLSLKEKRNVSIEFELDISLVSSIDHISSYMMGTLEDFSKQVQLDTARLVPIELNKGSIRFRFGCLLRQVASKELESRLREHLMHSTVQLALTQSSREPSS